MTERQFDHLYQLIRATLGDSQNVGGVAGCGKSACDLDWHGFIISIASAGSTLQFMDVQKPKRAGFVESHSFAKCANEWGTL
jgi:hypothetical protein